MNTRPSHYATRRKADLTPRQRDVLALIAAGRTNFEIADDLDLGYESVKTHVSAILERLDVTSREEAAAWWRQQHTWRARLQQLIPIPAMGSRPLKTASFTVAGVAVLLTATVFVIAMQSNGGESPPTNNGDETPTAGTASPTISPTTNPGATSTPQPATPTMQAPPTTAVAPAPTLPAPAPGVVTGLFETPRELNDGLVVSAPGAPVSPFSQVDGAVIYDVQSGTMRALGPGTRPVFSPDGKKAAWLASDGGSAILGGTVKVITLDTGVIEEFGTSLSVSFTDNETLVLQHMLPTPGPNKELSRRETLNIRTGVRTPEVPDVNGQPNDTWHVFEDLSIVLMSEWSGENTDVEIEVRRAGSSEPVVRFRANRAMFADRDTVVMATPLAGAWTNIFLIDLRSGKATYVATAIADEWNWPLAATSNFVAWTDNYCDDNSAPTRVYDRQAGTITTYQGAHWWFIATNQGLLQVDTFGGSALFDPATRAYVASVPQGQTLWSSDYRYASQGDVGGHGGLCSA